LDDQLRLLVAVRGVGHLQLEHAAPARHRHRHRLPSTTASIAANTAATAATAAAATGLKPPPAAPLTRLCPARPPPAAPRPPAAQLALLHQLVALDAVPAEVPVGGGGQQVQGPHRPVLLHRQGQHGRGEAGRVVVDVLHDHFAVVQLHPTLRGTDHRHLEVHEAVVLVEDHLTLRQLLAVDAPTGGPQLSGHVVDLEVVGARLQAERHLARPRARRDHQIGGHIPDPDVGRTLLGHPVTEGLFAGDHPHRRDPQPKHQREAAETHRSRMPLSFRTLPSSPPSLSLSLFLSLAFLLCFLSFFPSLPWASPSLSLSLSLCVCVCVSLSLSLSQWYRDLSRFPRPPPLCIQQHSIK
uniref:Uncharacterized protein n=1 Tax=Callorhinchus milii TaxID=7868 RepID=A0A4W3I5X2_CALMI